MALGISVSITGFLFYIRYELRQIAPYLTKPLLYFYLLDFVCLALLLFLRFHREEDSTISTPCMSRETNRLSKKLKRLFNDKQISDVLKLSNFTRYDNEMPEIAV
ncbi:hypothetical protein BOVMAS36_16390 [Streptococcus uberis]